MRYSFVKDILSAQWMIEPFTASASRPLLNGILMGYEFTEEDFSSVQSYVPVKNVPGKNINVLNLSGVMLKEDGECGYIGTRSLANLLSQADNDESCIGHIIKIDSGGGAANSVPVIADAIKKCKKKCIAFVDGMMCSAAMYVGSYCDYIMASDRNDRVGCIGTMAEIADYPSRHTDNNGRVRLRLYADGSEEKNAEYEAALNGDFSLIKENLLNPLAKQFREDVKFNRPAVTDIELKGKTFFASDVVGTLIDSLGSFNDAVNKLIELSNINIQKMEGLSNLQSIDSCRELQSVDGYVSLNEEQLSDIDSKLADLADNSALIAELEETKSNLETAISENSTLAQQVLNYEKTIEELRSALAENKKVELAEANHNGCLVNQNGDNANPEDYCKNLINRTNNG